MRKTKKLRKINKFTNKNKVGGMYSIQVDGITGERHVYGILFDITRSLTGTTHDMEIIKRDVILLINKFKVLNNKDKISFVKDLSRSFNEYHDRNPILIELYYMQIMTLIDATLTMSVFKPRSIILAKLSNDTMRMIAAACMTMSPEVPPQEMPPQDMLSHVMPPQVMPPQVMPIQEMPIQESEPIERPRQRRRLSSSIPPIGIS
jgi:hypothetical protein